MRAVVDSGRARKRHDLNLRSSASPEDVKTLEIIHVIDNLEPGGAQHILHALTQDNPTARVCALHSIGGAAEWLDRWPRVEILSRSKYALPVIIFRLVRLIRRNRSHAFFIAHLDASTLLLCLLRRLIHFRLVVTLHAIQGQWPGWFSTVFRRVVLHADHVISGGRRAYDETRALGITDDRITLIPIGSTRSATEGAGVTVDVRAELGIAADTPIFLNIARMVPGKGQIHLVRAMALIPDAVALIVGNGPEEARLRQEVERLGLEGRVRFVGRRTDLNNFYPVARAFVMPCLDESMGVVIYEALIFQLPIVAYASGTIGEIVTDGENGYLLAPDAEVLAAALKKVLRNEIAFRFLPPQNYSAATMLERHRALYLELARKWLIPAKGAPND